MAFSTSLDQPSGPVDLQTLALMCGCALSVMLHTLAVVLPTPHDYSGTFQGGYSARFTTSRRVVREQEGFCTIQRERREDTDPLGPCHHHCYCVEHVVLSTPWEHKRNSDG